MTGDEVDTVALDRSPLSKAPPRWIVRFAIALDQALRRLVRRFSPPHLTAFELGTGAAMTAMVAAVVRHGIPDILAERPMNADELAVRTGLQPDPLHRTLRALAFSGMFHLGSDGRFSNDRVSKVLCSGDPSQMRDFFLYWTSDPILDAYRHFDETLRTGASAFAKAHGHGHWVWLEGDTAAREHFARAMQGITVRDAPFVAQLCDLRGVEVLCDVGGGRGTLLSELVIVTPGLRGILCDAPGVLESARSLLAARGVADRIELRAGDFFTEVPSGVDAYLLKNVLHDWDDARSRQILTTVRAAMKPRARLILVESLLERDELSPAVLPDVHMMIAADAGRERTRAELHALLSATGFEVTRVAAGPLVSVIDAVAAEEVR